MVTAPAPSLANVPFRIDRLKLVRGLWIAAAALIAASLAGQVSRFYFGHGALFGLVQAVDVNNEQSFPTFFSFCLLIGAATLLKFIAEAHRATRAPFAAHWSWLSLGFFYLAADELVGIHECFSRPMNLIFGVGQGFFHYSWVIVGLGGVFLIVALYLPFLLNLPVRPRIAFILAGLIYVGGAVGMEMINGRYADTHAPDFTMVILTNIEEAMEMAGVILFIHALLRYCVAERITVSVTIRDPISPPR